MPHAVVLTIGADDLLSQFADALADGARIFDTEVTRRHLRSVEDGPPEEMVEDLRSALGLAIGTSLQPSEVEPEMAELHRLAYAKLPASEIHVRIATSFTSLSRGDHAAHQAVERMNRVLYGWGLVVVPPSYPGIDEFDDRAGVETAGDSVLAEASRRAAGRHGRRFGTAVGVWGTAMAHLGLLQV